MGQFIFFALLIMTLLAGTYSYFAPSQKPIDPMKFVMDKSGFNSTEAINRKKSEQLNVTTNKGLMQIHRQMDNIAQEQSKFFDMLQDQQRVLKDTGNNVSNIMLEAQQNAKSNQDVLQLKSLASQIQDQQNLSVARGQDLIVLNDQLTQNRESIAEDMDVAKINTEDSLRVLHDKCEVLENESGDFFNKIVQYNQEVRDQMDKIKDKLQVLADNSVYKNGMQQQNIKQHIHSMLGKERENMMKLADIEQRGKDLLEDAQEKEADLKQQLDDKVQEEQDMVEEERQKSQDEESMSQQRIADQKQRIQDQQDQ